MMTILLPIRAGIDIDTLQSLPILDVVPLDGIVPLLSSIYDDTRDASLTDAHGLNLSLAASTNIMSLHADLAAYVVVNADARRRCPAGSYRLDKSALAASMMYRRKERGTRRGAPCGGIDYL
jgi:hypothetical protein